MKKTIVFDGNKIGYQFNANSNGKRVVERTIKQDENGKNYVTYNGIKWEVQMVYIADTNTFDHDTYEAVRQIVEVVEETKEGEKEMKLVDAYGVELEVGQEVFVQDEEGSYDLTIKEITDKFVKTVNGVDGVFYDLTWDENGVVECEVLWQSNPEDTRMKYVSIAEAIPQEKLEFWQIYEVIDEVKDFMNNLDCEAWQAQELWNKLDDTRHRVDFEVAMELEKIMAQIDRMFPNTKFNKPTFTFPDKKVMPLMDIRNAMAEIMSDSYNAINDDSCVEECDKLGKRFDMACEIMRMESCNYTDEQSAFIISELA